MRVRRQPEHHGDAAIVVQRGPEKAAAALVGRVEPLMLLNSSAGPVPGPCASRMMVPSSMLGSTSASITLQLALRLQRADPAAQVAEGGGLTFVGFLSWPGPHHCGRQASPPRWISGIGAAAAGIAGEVVRDLVLAGVGIAVQGAGCHQHEAGRAEAALRGAAIGEGLLHGRRSVAVGARCSTVTTAAPSTEGRQVEAPGDGARRRPAPCSTAQALRTARARSGPVWTNPLQQNLDDERRDALPFARRG